MLFNDFLDSTAPKIESELKKILAENPEEQETSLTNLFKSFSDANFGGKFLRGVLVILGYTLSNGPDNKDIYKAASALEILHTSLLAHDDIIDKSLIRRGKKSLYAALGGDHDGVSQAICLGDFGFFLSVKLISGTDFKPEFKIKTISLLSEILSQTLQGEMLDIKLAKDKSYKIESSLNIALLKTAKYSLSGPLTIGAILAGASDNLIKKLTEIGDKLGVAYQIQDDILGVFGEFSQTGKSSASDISEGKATLLISEALKKSNPKQKQILKNLYGKSQINESEVEEVKNIFIQTGGLEFAEIKKVEYATQAQKMIEGLEKREFLTGLIDLLIKRKK